MSRQPTKTFCSAIVAILSTLVSCGGRIHENPGRHIDRSSAGLVAAQPALLVFGAIWCKPCRREIHDLNKAHAIYREQLGIVGMTVEGPEPGQIIQDLDLVKFRTPDGEMPTYSIHPDPNWKIFDSLLPESGHQLPLMVFVGADGAVKQMVQRSLNFDLELIPNIDALLANSQLKTPEKPVLAHKTIEVKGAELAAFGTSEEVIQSLQQSWKSACLSMSFSPEEMPFAWGEFTFDAVARTPLHGEWVSQAGCHLNVQFEPDGALKSFDGYCG